jgi:hypothetical protein
MTEDEIIQLTQKTRAIAVVMGTALRKLIADDMVAEGTVLCLMLAAHCASVETVPGHTMEDYLKDHTESVQEMLADIEAQMQTAQ